MNKSCCVLFLLSLLCSHIAAQCSGTPQILTASSGTFDDGSGDSPYPNGEYCTWLIQPQGAAIVRLEITSFWTDQYDSLSIYDGTSTSGTYLTGPLSGNLTDIPVIYSYSPSVYVVFSTSIYDNAPGWSINYLGLQQATPTCSGITVQNYSNLIFITGLFNLSYPYSYENAGYISDGSGSQNYSNNLDCEWVLTVTSGYVINITFSAFDILPNDSIQIFDGPTTNSPLLSSLSGHPSIQFN